MISSCASGVPRFRRYSFMIIFMCSKPHAPPFFGDIFIDLLAQRMSVERNFAEARHLLLKLHTEHLPARRLNARRNWRTSTTTTHIQSPSLKHSYCGYAYRPHPETALFYSSTVTSYSSMRTSYGPGDRSFIADTSTVIGGTVGPCNSPDQASRPPAMLRTLVKPYAMK